MKKIKISPKSIIVYKCRSDRYIPVDGFRLMTVEAKRAGEIAGPTAELGVPAFTRHEALVDARRAEEGDQRRTEFLPKKGREVGVSVDLLG